MTSSDTLFATTRLTLGLSRQLARSPDHTESSVALDDAFDRRKGKRKRDKGEGIAFQECELNKDEILTPGSTPLSRTSMNDSPLLAHRYLPISIAGDGAFSRTIMAQDILDPTRPMVAIKAMKPGFELIGQQVLNSWCRY
jgi:hypothetical protein